MRPVNLAMSPLLWAVHQLGRFLRDGYGEIRVLLAANTPGSVKRKFTGSLAALLVALLTVMVLASQIHPVVVVLAAACVLLIAYGRSIVQRLALFAGYFLCGFVLFIVAGLIIVAPLEKTLPLLSKILAVALFVVLCLVFPALLSLRPRHAIVAAEQAGSIGLSVETKKPTVTFQAVGGMVEPKQQIAELVRANLDAKNLGKYRISRNGILLHGPRGTGKTLLAEAIAGEFGLHFFPVPTASLLNKFVGLTEESIRNVFEEAKRCRPVVLFLDEIDAVGTKRQQIGDSDDGGGAARSFNSMTLRLMDCIDDVRKHPDLILVAATNFYDGLDRALIREGRFDLHIRLDLPSETERLSIFTTQLAKRPAKTLDLVSFARQTPGWSAAKIAALIDRAAVRAAAAHRPIETRDLTDALASTGGRDRAPFKEVDWDDVVISPDTEADLRDLIRLMDPVYSERLKIRMPTGLLLVGAPGTGKTMIARLLATQTKRSFYPITAADVLGGATGASVKKLTELFARAKENSPSIIFIDEIDGLLPRNTGFQTQHDIQFVEQARTLISDLEPNHNVFLVGTTNHIDNIDPAILRGGRFSEKIHIGVPHDDGYRRLVARHVGDVRLSADLTIEAIAGKLKGVSPADLEAICTSAKRMAMRRMPAGVDELPPLVWADFAEAMKRVQIQF